MSANNIFVYESQQSLIHIVFIKNEDVINIINYEYHEDFRSDKSLMEIMLLCEKKYGPVVGGLSVDYHSLYQKGAVEEIAKKYISNYEQRTN